MVKATETAAAAAAAAALGEKMVEVFKPAAAAAVKKSEEATVVNDSSDDDEIEPAQDAIRAAKSSLGGKHFEHDSDEGSYFSESSEEDKLKTAADAKANALQFSSSDDESDLEELVVYRPRMSAHPRPINSSLPRVTDEWSSLKEVPLTQIGSRKGSEPITPLQQNSKAALGYEEKTYSHFEGVDEKSRMMAAAQAAAIPSDDDSFGADSDNALPRARASSRSKSKTTRSYRSETSTTVISTPPISQYHEEVDSDKGSSLSNDDESESSIFDDESDYEDDQHQPTNEWRNSNEDDVRKDSRSLSGNGVYFGEGEDDSDESKPVKKSNKNKRNANSSSFSAQSRNFNWADVKSKIFYSFRALKASSGSGEEGSRTISVKNLAREVTNNMLYEIFQEVGSITNVRMTGAAGRSGVGSAYVEFESGANARKAVQQKNGKMLEGRMISCDIAYESTRTAGDGVSGSSGGGFSGSSHGGADSVLGSSHGKKKQQSGLSRADSAPILGRGLSGLHLFDPKVQDGDSKFLSRFNDPATPYGHYHPPLPGDALSRSFKKERRSGGNRDVALAHVKPSHGYTEPGNYNRNSNDGCKNGGSREVTFDHINPPPPGYPLPGNSKKDPKTGGSTDLALAPWSRSYGIVPSAVDKSVLCSERNAVVISPVAKGLKSAWPLRRVQKKSKWGRFLMPWRRSKLQWWQFAELSAAKVARGQSLENHPYVHHAKGEGKRPKGESKRPKGESKRPIQFSVGCSC